MSGPGSGKGFWAAARHAFAIPEEESLTDAERTRLRTLAQKVVQRRLAAPAVMLLESLRPLNYIGAQALLFFKPIISLAFPPELCDELAGLLQKRQALGALADMIEQLQAEGRPHKPDPGS